jgi:hypothetical protein
MQEPTNGESDLRKEAVARLGKIVGNLSAEVKTLL